MIPELRHWTDLVRRSLTAGLSFRYPMAVQELSHMPHCGGVADLGWLLAGYPHNSLTMLLQLFRRIILLILVKLRETRVIPVEQPVPPYERGDGSEQPLSDFAAFKVSSTHRCPLLIQPLNAAPPSVQAFITMVRHNNVVPNQHFKKKWHQVIGVRTWFNQPARKIRRRAGEGCI